MAQKEASLIVRLIDKASQGMKGIGASFSSLKTNILAVSAALAGVTAFLASSVKEFFKQENAINKLNTALINQGKFTEETSKDLQNFASSLQRVTTVGDETILETQALLTTFGLTGDQLKETTKAALDLSAGLGIDLKASTLLLGKAFAGDITTLSRYGIKLKEGIPPADRFNAVLTQLQERFGGEAQARLETTSGKLENFSNRIGDLKERIGSLLIPAIDFFLDKLDIVVGSIENVASSAAPFKIFAIQVAQIFLELSRTIIEFMAQPFEAMAPILEKFGIDVTAVMSGINAYIDEQQFKLTQLMAKTEMEAQKSVSAEQKKYDTKRSLAALDIKETEKENRKELEEEKNKKDEQKKMEAGYNATVAKIENEMHARRIKQDQERRQNFQSTISYISQLSTSENRRLAAVGKAAGIAQATIDTYAAATRALASAPPPFNFALAAAVTAAGLANVARISGVPLAEGGVVMPTRGGTFARIGEAGKPEAVIPLDDDRAREAIGENFGGLTININAGTIIADDTSIKEFAERIDEELFRLNTNNRSIAL